MTSDSLKKIKTLAESLKSHDLDQWFFEHPEVIKPPELCRNKIPKIVYFKSEVDKLKPIISALISVIEKQSEFLNEMAETTPTPRVHEEILENLAETEKLLSEVCGDK